MPETVVESPRTTSSTIAFTSAAETGGEGLGRSERHLASDPGRAAIPGAPPAEGAAGKLSAASRRAAPAAVSAGARTASAAADGEEGAPVSSRPCPVCGGQEGRIFFEASAVPVHCSVLWETKAAAQACPTGEVRLAFCGSCGMIFNAAFDPSLIDYTADYENSLEYSPRFRNYAEDLAKGLIERYGLQGKEVMEIGCGKGEFLELLCSLGAARGLGFDASYEGPAAAGEGNRVTVVREGYSAKHAGHTADLICCRHVLEHVQAPRELLSLVREAASRRKGSAVYFEVPNGLFTLRDLGIWDVIYAHCSYFTDLSLGRLFRECGFAPSALTTGFDDQFLGIEASAAGRSGSGASGDAPSRESLSEIESLVEAFGQQHRRKVSEWKNRLGDLFDDGARIVIWGSGAKGVTFLSTVDRERRIEYAVDLNPRKHGKFVPLSGQEVIGPQGLRDIQPDVVVVMNPIYRAEILEKVRSLSLRSKVLVA